MDALLEFSVANNRSINELCTFSMVATAISDKPTDNIFKVGNNKILRSAVVYGANSSGKSNIVKSLSKMCAIVRSSVRLNDGDPLDYEPFLYCKEDASKPTHFEIVFISGEHKYRYGFEYSLIKIESEWLYRTAINGKKETELFYRELDIIECNNKLFSEGVDKVKLINANRLLISLCAQLGGEESKIVMSWFQRKLNVISGISTDRYSNYSRLMLNNNLEGCEDAKRFFTQLQLGFNNIECVETEFDLPQLSGDIQSVINENFLRSFASKKQIELFSVHNVYDSNGTVVDQIPLDLEKTESEGTKKIIELSGPIFDTLNEGKVLVVDELDVKLHPHITHHIISLFNNPETNPNAAQMFFTTHDTHLLASNLFRRDQIWFTEKDTRDQTELYNMMDILLPDGSKPRNDANYEKNYIAGRYGAIPYIKNF